MCLYYYNNYYYNYYNKRLRVLLLTKEPYGNTSTFFVYPSKIGGRGLTPAGNTKPEENRGELT